MRIISLLMVVLAFGRPATAQECVTSAPQVVDDVFQQVLGRPADPGSAGLTQALASGQLSVRDVVATVAKSPEYEARFFWPPLVAAVYRQVMQRQPTDAEVQQAATGLARGTITPPAFVAHVATRAANNSSDPIRMVYRRLLGRDPDPEGLAAHAQMAERNGLDAVTLNIVSSPEYRARATAGGFPVQDVDPYEQTVRRLYRQLLGRDADAEGLSGLAELAAVYGIKGPVDRMLNSAEYRQRYGDNAIPGRDVAYCGAPLGRRTAVPRRR